MSLVVTSESLTIDDSCNFDTILSELSDEYELTVTNPIFIDDTLRRVLKTLVELPDIPLTLFCQNHDDVMQSPVYLDDVIFEILKGDRTTFPSTLTVNRWSESCSLHTLSVNRTRNDEVNATTILHYWSKRLVLLSKLTKIMSASEMHTTVSTMNYISNTDNDNVGCQMYQVTCILLCCVALQNLTEIVVNSDILQPRWQRSQSLLFETFRMYDTFHRHFEKNHVALQFSTSIWMNYVLPSTSRWNRTLWNEYLPFDQIRNPTHRSRIWRWYMAFEAASIACTDRIAIQYLTHIDDSIFQFVLNQLVSTINDYILYGQFDLLCEHVWRHQYGLKNEDILLSSYRMHINNESCPSPTVALTYYTIAFTNEEIDEERRDLLCGLSPVWSTTFIALFSFVGWDIRPNVWSKHYQWQLFFPYVKVLLNCGDIDELDQLELLRPLGYILLHQLLSEATQRSIRIPSNIDAPDSPIGTFQLLTNQMMYQPTSDITHHSTPSGKETFHIMKLLLNVYVPKSQVDIVLKLQQNCPHPGVRAKLIDLLRTFIDWNDKYAEEKVWSIVKIDFLAALEDKLESNKSYSVGTDNFLMEIVDDTEFYLASLGLLQVWLKCKCSVLDVDALYYIKARLIRIDSKLLDALAMLDNFGSNQADESIIPDRSSSAMYDFYKLHLLEYNIQETIDSLSHKQETKKIRSTHIKQW